MNEKAQDNANLNVELALLAHGQNAKYVEVANDAAVNASLGAIKNLFLMNGGALVAMLAFISGIIGNSGGIYSLSQFAAPMMYFSFGLALATLSSGGAYLTNLSYSSSASFHAMTWEHPYLKSTPKSKKWVRIGVTFHIVSVVSALLSLALFIVGFWSVRSVFLGTS